MIYPTAQAWRDAPHKRVVLFAMSGLGKTYISEILAETGSWFHYSIDYRIGTRYMGEHIADNLKREAMKVPFLREMLLADAIHISANVHDHDLTAVSAYTGKPGNAEQGGLSIDEFRRRQRQFEEAEVAALLDTRHFIKRAEDVYGYEHFICDTGGSICEWVTPDDADDRVLKALSEDALLVWIKGDAAHTDELVRRFDKSPKPMCYQPAFLEDCWSKYLSENNVSEDDVDPDHFVRWTYARALAHREPLYSRMADWGVTVTPDQISNATSHDGFVDMIAAAIEAKGRM